MYESRTEHMKRMKRRNFWLFSSTLTQRVRTERPACHHQTRILPGVKHGPVLQVSLLMHQQDVPILGLSVTEERSVQDLYGHLGFRQLSPADREQQRGAEPAQHRQQHANTNTPQYVLTNKQQDQQASKTSGQMLCRWSSTWHFHHTCCCRNLTSDWLLS